MFPSKSFALLLLLFFYSFHLVAQRFELKCREDLRLFLHIADPGVKRHYMRNSRTCFESVIIRVLNTHWWWVTSKVTSCFVYFFSRFCAVTVDASLFFFFSFFKSFVLVLPCFPDPDVLPVISGHSRALCIFRLVLLGHTDCYLYLQDHWANIVCFCWCVCARVCECVCNKSFRLDVKNLTASYLDFKYSSGFEVAVLLWLSAEIVLSFEHTCRWACWTHHIFPPTVSVLFVRCQTRSLSSAFFRKIVSNLIFESPFFFFFFFGAETWTYMCHGGTITHHRM